MQKIKLPKISAIILAAGKSSRMKTPKALLNWGEEKLINQAEMLARESFAKSAYAIKDLPVGHRLKNDDVVFKSPGKGIFPHELEEFLGKDLKVFFKTKKELDKYCNKEGMLHQGYVAEIEHLDKISLKDFIKDTITTLIGPALSPRCFGNEMRGTRTRVSMTTVNAPFADGPKDRMSNQPSEEPFGNILVTEIQPFPTGENRMGLMSGDYFIVYANSQGARSLNAWEPSHAEAEARDAEEGIPWIKMGCDRGLTKKVKFKKMEIPGMRESHMTNPTDGGDTPNYRPMPYNVDVEMFGNSIFKPGMMLYVDPAMVVSSAPGATFDAIKGMGLGGYYTVLKAKGAIERGKFSTDVECIFTAFGDGQPDPNTPEESCGDDGDTDGMPTPPADMEMP